ncbi:MAG: hypothetical protein SF066_14435 [Thermoanaerobaculia bacterium]|nr:hypothetical protein [Thermoanaerobaculia bacterium]
MQLRLSFSSRPGHRGRRPLILAALFVATASWAALFAAGTSTSWTGVPTVEPIMPSDVKLPVSQFNFNNLAWQQFITLNWVADSASPGQPDASVPPSAFGNPGDTRPVVWETYKESSEVFLPEGAVPAPWGATRALPAAFARTTGFAQLQSTLRSGVKGLIARSKFTAGPSLQLADLGGPGGIVEAGTGGAWLTAQPKMNNYLTLFEKRLNQDEFNYITQNQLYDASNQASFATVQGINLPDGSKAFASYGTVGAIEIKAAWIQLDDPAVWPLFKISQAYVSYPLEGGGQTPPALVTVGLVGLHIIRKTPNAQQFVWSTFEHVNNDPSTTDIQKQTLKTWYTYYNAACNPATDYYKCEVNRQPIPGTDPYHAPVQVVRTTPLSTSTANNIVALNQSVWATIAAANPQSVFLNYQLVNTLWPNANTSIPPGSTTPLTDGNAQPPESQQPVANTVLETYLQGVTCQTCHTNAPIASASAGTARSPVRIRRSGSHPPVKTLYSAPLAADYSFLFSEAESSPAARPER